MYVVAMLENVGYNITKINVIDETNACCGEATQPTAKLAPPTTFHLNFSVTCRSTVFISVL
jgi:hypothetical protein